MTRDLLTRSDTRTVLVCDDRKELRVAIGDLLAQLPAFVVVGFAVDATTCLDGVRAWRPDILILDVNMPGGGPGVAAAAKGICPNLHIVVFSGHHDDIVRRGMLAAGADQYVVKTGRLNPLLAALRRVTAEPAAGPPPLPAQRGPAPERPPASGGAQGGSGPPPHPLTSSFVL